MDIPSSVVSLSEKYFDKNILLTGLRFLRSSKTTLSFIKGTPETYYIVSGIIKDDRTYEAKLVFKKRLEDTGEMPLTSNCDCSQWRQSGHCPHVASLFAAYHSKLFFEQEDTGVYTDGPRPPIMGFGQLGVTVEEYGTIVAAPHKLIGAPNNATYSSLQYVLTNKKTVHFPIVANLPGKLHLLYEYNQIENSRRVRFAYENTNGDVIREISIFEHIYLFNWRQGEVYNLPSPLKTLIQKIRGQWNHLEINDYIKYLHVEDAKDYCRVSIDGKLLDDFPKAHPHCRIDLKPGERPSLIELVIMFHDNVHEIPKLLPIPELLKTFTFNSGLLSSFRKKIDAYKFIEEYCYSTKDTIETYKQFLIPLRTKNEWLEVIHRGDRQEQTIVFDAQNESVCYFDNSFLRLILTALNDSFKEQTFRFAELRLDGREYVLQINSTQLFQGLAEFHRRLTPYGVEIFYDRNKISAWSSRVRFERRNSAQQWFDLEMVVDNQDLEIIQNADLETGIALTANGMILLTPEQKDIMRFMKRYTEHEAQNATPLTEQYEGATFNKFILPFNRARIFELFELKKFGMEGALLPEEIALCEKLTNLETMPVYDLPEHLTDILRPYQKTGFNWLRFLYEHKLGACLADDMGLGKTLQTIAFLQSIYSKINRVLVICPVTILLNWEKEITKFSNMPISIYHGGAREFSSDVKIILTSYGVMKKEAQKDTSVFTENYFDILILDEVQHLKNIRSLGAFSARRINAGFRICLTGTPVENDLSEFYNILDLSMPGVWGDLQFIRTTSNSKSRLIARKTAAPFILRRTKAQVLPELPPKIENNVYLNFSEEEDKFYKQSLNRVRLNIKESTTVKKYGEILKGLLTLRQNCLWQKHPQLESTKINFLVETLEQIIEEGHQTLVFSQFTTYLDLIQNILREKNWKLSRIDGSQSITKRQAAVDEFQAGKTQIFLISLKAGGVGLNLTAASYVFVMDPWWNPAVESQAIDRAHRIGQKNKLTVYRPIIKDTVEEKVLKLQDTKRELFKDLLPDNDEQYFTGKLSMKDFEALFGED
jgi:SNF2 family DNA or RNA helicase